MKRLPDYVASTVKLSGKELDDEIVYRRSVKEQRIAQRIGTHKKAKELGIKPTEVLAYEYGYDICPHDSYKKHLLGFPVPKAIFEQCEKCGIPKENSLEKITDKNIEESYRIFKEIREEEMAKEENKKCQKS